MSTMIKVDHAVKKYGDKVIIPDLSVQIEPGEFFTLLGPSGCGKTTLLRMIAGFNSIEGGSICFNERRINDIPPYQRNIGMVFQNYAIFPHMTVRKNVEYGLRQRKIPKEEIVRRADDMMKTVKITEHADKSPSQLSGGQQQRVALARAIVIEPAVLLMDEPLSNLDAKLRVEMRSAIRDIQKNINITTVYVTHDQEEALAVSDRIAIMNFGEIQQVGDPVSLYQRPANIFVATFIGTSNIFQASYQRERQGIAFESGLFLPMNHMEILESGTSVQVSVRPEDFEFADSGIPATVKSEVFLGRYINYEMVLPSGQMIEVSQDAGQKGAMKSAGEHVFLKPDAARINVFTADGSRSLMKEG